jgi:hypothetical protein
MAPGDSTGTWVGSVMARLVPLVAHVRAVYLLEERRKQQEKEILDAVPKYPDIEVYLSSGDPQIILHEVCRALHAHGIPAEEIQAFVEDALSEDYGHMLVTIARWVSVP